MREVSKWTVKLGALGAVAALFLVACGDDGGGGGSALPDSTDPADLEELVEDATPTTEAADSESSDTESTAPTDACELLTVDEVAAVMGEATATPSNGPSDGGGAGCTWTGPDGIKTIYLVAWPSTDYYSPDQLGLETVPVSGLGDEAVYSDAGKFVLWTQDDRAFQLQAPWADSPTQDDMVGLAQSVSGRV
jgi:hypothetical protein